MVLRMAMSFLYTLLKMRRTDYEDVDSKSRG